MTAPTALAAGTVTLSGLTAPTDVWVTGPFSVSGSVDNSDTATPPTVQTQLVVDSSLSSTQLTGAAFTGSTCDVPGGTAQPVDITDDLAGKITLTCHQDFPDNTASAPFDFQLAMNAPAGDADSVPVTVNVVDSGTTTVEATSTLPALTLHPAPHLSGLTAPTDVSVKAAAFAVSGSVDDDISDPSSAQPAVQMQLVLDGSAVTPTLPTASMFAGSTCDVPGGTAQQVDAVDDAAGKVTLTCPAGTASSSSSSSFAFHLHLLAPADDTGTITATVNALDSATLEATSTLPVMTLRAAPTLSVTAPSDPVGTNAVSFSGQIDNTNGAPQALRLGIVASMSGLTPLEIHLRCGSDPTDVAFTTDVNENLVGHCPTGTTPGDGFTVDPSTPMSLAFQLRFDNGAPTNGQLLLTFTLDALDTSSGQALAPDLASTPTLGPITVFPPNTVTVSASPPGVLATGSAPKTYGGEIDNTSAGHTYPSVHPTIVAGWTGTAPMPTSSVQLSCDGGSQWATFPGSSISSGQQGIATCADSRSISAPDTAPLNFKVCIDSGAPTGTLTLQTKLVDDNGGLQIAAETNPHVVQVIAGPASTGTCRNAGPTLVWTGAQSSDWATGANWDGNAAPTSGDTVVIPANAAITGVTGVVDTLIVGGGTDPSSAAALSFDGNLTVQSLTRLSGFVRFDDGSGQPSGLLSNAQFTTAPSTNLQLADVNTSLNFPAGATFSFGDSTSIHRPAAPTGANPKITVSGVLVAGKSMTLDKIDLDLASGASIDTHGATLGLSGPSRSTWADGASITDVSASGGGAVSLGNQATLATTGTLTVAHNGILRLLSGSVLDGGAGLTLAGPGTLDWQAGALSGAITLASTLVASGGGAGASIADAGNVTNLATLRLTVTRGQSYELDGQLDNKGTIVISPGAVITSLAAQSTLTNEAGATLALASGTSQGVALLSGVHLRNFGAITVPTDETLRDEGGSVFLAGSSTVIGGGVPTTTSGSTAPPAGALALGAGATGELAGAVTLKSNAVLALDGGTSAGAATPPTLTADSGGALNADSAATKTDGAFHWCFGTVTGSLGVGKNIATEVGPGNVSGSCRIGNPVTVNLGGTVTASGPATVNNTTFVEAPHARAVFAGSTAFGMTTTFSPPSGASVDDQGVVVDTAGSVDIPNLASAPGISQSSNVTFGIPLTVNGSLVNEGKMSATVPLTNNGTVSMTKAVNATSVVNTGTWFLGAATLTTTAGYAQHLPAGATSATPTPVTRFTDPSGVLSTTTMTLTDGGLIGGGTVNATDVVVGAGFIRPSFSFGAATTLTINAAVHLSKKSDMQVVIYSATSRDVIKMTKPAALAGKITGFTASPYVPKYLQTVSGVITFPSHTGGFTDSAWGGTPNGLGWKPKALASTAKQVDEQLVDVAPPSLGIASIAVFTEFAKQRVTYAAVDNKTGVKSYDVRWRSGSPTKAYSGWHYPSTWQRTIATSETMSGLAVGYSYCFSVRVRDKAGNTTPWSVPQCASRMFDDHALAAHGSWTRPSKKLGFYFKTYSQTGRRGASLTKAGTFTRIGVIAQVCPRCGTIGIYSGKTLIKKWNLRSSKARLASFISKVLTSRKATVTIRSLSSGKPVIVDAFGMLR